MFCAKCVGQRLDLSSFGYWFTTLLADRPVRQMTGPHGKLPLRFDRTNVSSRALTLATARTALGQPTLHSNFRFRTAADGCLRLLPAIRRRSGTAGFGAVNLDARLRRMTNASEVHAAFAAMLMSLTCPACGRHYSDAAVQWCLGYMDGRHDMLVEIGGAERDGPDKIRCANCEARASVNYFGRTASLIE